MSKKPAVKPAVNVDHVTLFNAACLAATGMAQACEALARALIGKGRGKDDYDNAIKQLSALEAASVDGNRHTVRRYTSECLAILAQHGRKVVVPTVAKDRTEKAQGARKSLGTKPRGVKAKPETATATVAPMSAQDGETWFRAQLKLQAGRASLITIAQSEGFDLTFGLRDTVIKSAPLKTPTIPAPAMPEIEAPVSPEARKPGKPRGDSLAGVVHKANGKNKPSKQAAAQK